MNDDGVRDIWVRYTSVGGKSHVLEHRVWNVERFMLARAEDCAKVNRDHWQACGQEGKAKAEQITKEQYMQEHKK